ncbi:MAG: DUF389 domain-containing protein, partial [Mycobacterium pseudokansasii]|nr:DUF389 domain-containing protein [Mycobacterium pseudokansasii]
QVARQSAVQLGVNLAGIVLAGVLVLWVHLRTGSRRRGPALNA